MHRLMVDLPTRVETERLLLRPYEAYDGPAYYAMARRNREHLSVYESGNAANSLSSVDEAEILMREFALEWAARRAFFLGAYERESGAFVAQIYIGVVDWELSSFVLGYFADVDHQRLGYVTEAARGALLLIFGPLGGTRVAIYCDEHNERSAAVAERLGFTREAHLRNNHRAGERPVSGDFIYGLLRDEYLSRGGVPLPPVARPAPVLRSMSAEDILQVRRLDRRELIEQLYHLEEGRLVLVPERYDMQGWPPGQIDKIVAGLRRCHAEGGWLLGAFEGERLIGLATLEASPVASAPEQLQLGLLQVGYGYRDRGLGGALFEAARAEAARRGARDMYVSATPSEHTVRFYMAHGCRLNPTPDPTLYAAEPEDIHLLCVVG